MGRFIGNSFVLKEDVQGEYRTIPEYDTAEDENKDIGNVVLVDDYNVRIRDIENDVKAIIVKLERYDLADAIDDLKILAEKLY